MVGKVHLQRHHPLRAGHLRPGGRGGAERRRYLAEGQRGGATTRRAAATVPPASRCLPNAARRGGGLFAHAEACGFGHRSRHRTPISGSIKVRVLTRAKGRCECCGAGCCLANPAPAGPGGRPHRAHEPGRHRRPQQPAGTLHRRCPFRCAVSSAGDPGDRAERSRGFQCPARGNRRHREIDSAPPCGSDHESRETIEERRECVESQPQRFRQSPGPTPTHARRTSAGFPEDPPPPLAGSEPRGASSKAELDAHVIPWHCYARVGEMGRPAPIQLSAEGRIDRQRPISGLVIEAVPEGDRQSKPFVLGQLKKVRHGCHRHQERLRTQRRNSPWWSRGGRDQDHGSKASSSPVPPPVTPRPTKPARTRNPRQDPPMPSTPSPTYERLRDTIAKRMRMSARCQLRRLAR